jgi:hypothetical protein
VNRRLGIALAARGNRAYLSDMVQPISTPQEMSAPVRPQGRLASAIAWSAASLGGILLLGAGALWFHYGTTVFFEMIAAGVSACF